LSKSDKRGWLTRVDNRHGLSPILYDTAPLFSLLTLVSYCAIVFSFALIFANNGWFTACDGFYDVSACWLSHMKQ